MAELFAKGKGVAFPLIDLQSVGGYTDKNNFLFLKLLYKKEKENDSVSIFFKPKDDSNDGKEWEEYWRTLICTVAVAEGRFLV